MFCSHLIFNICFSFSHCGHSLEVAGWSPEQLAHLAGLSHRPDAQCSG